MACVVQAMIVFKPMQLFQKPAMPTEEHTPSYRVTKFEVSTLTGPHDSIFVCESLTRL